MTIVDKRQPKPRKSQDRPRARVAFTDEWAPNAAPAVLAVDAQPRAGDYAVPVTYSVGGEVIGTGTIIMNRNNPR